MRQTSLICRVSAVSQRRWTLALLAFLVSMAVPAVSWAHPLGNFTINHYSRLELSPGQARIFYVLDMAEIPAFQIIQQIDRDGDKQVSPEEGTAFAIDKMEELRQGLVLTLDGVPVDLRSDGSPNLNFPSGQGGLAIMRLTFWLTGPLPRTSKGPIATEYRNANDVGRIGWREIVVRGQDGLEILDASAFERDQSDELRTYPQDMLSTPLDQRSARFSLQLGGRATSISATARPLGAAPNDSAFAALVALPSLDPPVVLLALATALALGALHALEPGHGKTVAAAYLIGTRATARHALLLGLTVTVMHTASVFILGVVTLFASRFILPEHLLPWLGLASGLIVIALGVRMVVSRLRTARAGSNVPLMPQHHHAHPHGHDHTNDHGDDHHHHDHGPHHLPPALVESKVTWRSVLAIGVSGGLLPCPAALVVLLSAVGLGRLGFGMLLIVAFSAGLALVLSSIGLAVLYGGRWLNHTGIGTRAIWRIGSFGWLARFVPALGGLLVIAAGGLLLYNALPLLRIWQL